MSRVLLITPARNEADHLQRTIEAVAAQTRRPDLWVIVDDGSSDETPQILAAAATRLDFVRVLRTASPLAVGADGLAVAAEARAFNLAVAETGLDDFTHLGKLDADIELPADYFERLLPEFDRSPQLGIAGGVLLEQDGAGAWTPTSGPAHHVRGALKLYDRACFEWIGGIEERLGWDTIDEVYARMGGFETASLPWLAARHHRPVATRGGALRGRARLGHCAYVLRYPAWWVVPKSVSVARWRPIGLSGVAYLYGYLRAFARREGRVESEAFRHTVARELRARARAGRLGGGHPGPRTNETKVPTNFMRS